METISINSCGNSSTLSNSISIISSSSTDDSGPVNGTTSSVSAIGKTNLIVNYLPQTMVDEEFRTLFESQGPVDTCRLIKNKLNNQSLCYGFVNYIHWQDADKACKNLNGLKIENKIIKVSYARPSSETIKGANLYICGLPKQWTVDDLNAYFSRCGRIITSRILYNQANGQSKGVGFVRFDQKSEADRAINELNGIIPNSSTSEPISVKYANFPTESTKYLPNIGLNLSPVSSCNLSKSVHQPQQTTLQQIIAPVQATNPFQIYRNDFLTTTNGATGGSLLALPNIYASPSMHSTQNLTPPTQTTSLITTGTIGSSVGSTASTGWCIFVYNLAPDTDDSVLWQLFGPFGAVLNVRIIKNLTNNKCRGFGFVTMGSYNEAYNAIAALNGCTIGNRTLQVSFKTNQHTIQ